MAVYGQNTGLLNMRVPNQTDLEEFGTGNPNCLPPGVQASFRSKRCYRPCPRFWKKMGYTTFSAGRVAFGEWRQTHSLPTRPWVLIINQGGLWKGRRIYGGGVFFAFNTQPNERYHRGEGNAPFSMKLAQRNIGHLSGNKRFHLLAYLLFYACSLPIQPTKANGKSIGIKADSMGIAEKGFEMERVCPLERTGQSWYMRGMNRTSKNEARGSVLTTLEEILFG